MPMDERTVSQNENCSQTASEQTADQQTQNSQQGTQQGSGATATNCKYGRNVVAYPQDVVLAATSLALAITKGRSQYEIETLINLFSLTTNNLQSILAQILINEKVQDILETPL